ncbi:MAG TPA: glycine cleavage system protein GcvH [Solirubrobacteraceae bacterium]|nr:glycine cleavage system protein GcvH [Solirubrobacteraceae bacterium]
MYPTDRRYTRDHEWASKQSNGTLRVGITDFAAKQLGEVVFVEMAKVGDACEADEPFGTIESVKAVSELFCPVAGKIAAVNEILDDSPDTVNGDPHGDGWIVAIKPDDPKAVDGLLTAAQYKALIAEAE